MKEIEILAATLKGKTIADLLFDRPGETYTFVFTDGSKVDLWVNWDSDFHAEYRGIGGVRREFLG